MKETRPSDLTYQEKMIQGSAWLSVGNIFSRLLGAIYIIPWYAWMGENARAANGLFNMGYTFYALFMMISTAGLPGAIAKQIARYNSMGEYQGLAGYGNFRNCLWWLDVFHSTIAGWFVRWGSCFDSSNTSIEHRCYCLSLYECLTGLFSRSTGYASFCRLTIG